MSCGDKSKKCLENIPPDVQVEYGGLSELPNEPAQCAICGQEITSKDKEHPCLRNVPVQYTIGDLKNPEPYQNDPELAAFARQFAGSIAQIIEEEHGWMPIGKGVELVMSGAYGDRLHKSWEKYRKKKLEQARQQYQDHQKAAEALDGLQLPSDVSVELLESQIRLRIPRDGGIMTPKIKRQGGYWDNDEKCFYLPLSAATSLPRILKNWEKARNKKAEETKKQQAEQAAARERARREREAARERARQEQKEAYERARREREAARERARANRVRIVAGSYQVGDIITTPDGRQRKIQSFGRSWVETKKEIPREHWHGWLYEDCPQCGREPVELEAGVCANCHPHSVHVTTEYCYAYFDEQE